MRLRTRFWVGVTLAALAAAPSGTARADQTGSPQSRAEMPLCDSATGPSIYCTDLVPTPDLRGVNARLELTPIPSPFGIAVTVDGHPRFRLVAIVEGLPEPAALGRYTRFVAWTTTIALDRESKLGQIRNGRNDLGEVAETVFRILVTAEASSDIARRAGRLVLRATAPTARLLAHRDIMTPTSPGSTAAPISPPSSGADRHDHTIPTGVAARNVSGSPRRAWSMPPMQGMPMMPGMAHMTPSVRPFLPGDGIDPRLIPDGKPQRVLHLAPGDTLELEAGLVQRRIGGRAFTMYGFNGQYPGPLIKVAQGATITVKFRNNLEMPSAVHWHGVRLDNRSDGAPGVTQAPVMPGESFVYTVHFKDAGTYWYHPHVREDIQQDLGLYGGILVAPSSEDYYSPANREEVLLIDDLLIGDDGLVPYGESAPTHALMGRFGNVFLVNGEPDYAMTVKRGEVVRFFLTNASSARVYNLSFGGMRMKVVGSDLGKFEQEAWVTSVVLGPAERYIVDVQFTPPGRVWLTNSVQSLNHMAGNFFAETHQLARIDVATELTDRDYSSSFAQLRRNADVTTDIDRYRPHFDRPVDYALTLVLRTNNLPPAIASMLLGPTVPVEWNDSMPMENWLVSGREAKWILREPATGHENMDIAWRFRVGDVIKLRLFNDQTSVHPMSHPIHIHGQRFLVLERNGLITENLVWKDTTMIAAGETVDVLLELSNPGRWMLHCHIAEHLGAGMMMVFRVEER